MRKLQVCRKAEGKHPRSTSEGATQTYVLCLCSFFDKRKCRRDSIYWVHDHQASPPCQGTTSSSI